MSRPDAEKIIGDYLRSEMTTTERVGGNTPASVEDPWVRITQIDDESMDGGVITRSVAVYLQIDCFAGRSGTKANARAMADEVCELLADAENQIAAAVVSGAETRMSRQPDTSFEPEMQRYIVTATIWMHS